MKKIITLLSFAFGLYTPIQATEQPQVYIIDFFSAGDSGESHIHIIAASVDIKKNEESFKLKNPSKLKSYQISAIDLYREKNFDGINNVDQDVKDITSKNMPRYNRKRLEDFFATKYGKGNDDDDNFFNQPMHKAAYNSSDWNSKKVWSFDSKTKKWYSSSFDEFFSKQVKKDENTKDTTTENDEMPQWKKRILWGGGVSLIVIVPLGLWFVYNHQQNKKKETKNKKPLQ